MYKSCWLNIQYMHILFTNRVGRHNATAVTEPWGHEEAEMMEMRLGWGGHPAHMGQMGKRRLLLEGGGSAAWAPDSQSAERVVPGAEAQTGAGNRLNAQQRHNLSHQLEEDCSFDPPLTTHWRHEFAVVDGFGVSLAKAADH